MIQTLKILFVLTTIFFSSCLTSVNKNINTDNSDSINLPIPKGSGDTSRLWTLGPSDLFVEMTDYLDSLGYSFDTTRIKKVGYFSNKKAFSHDDKCFYHIDLPNHPVFHPVGFTNNYDGIDTSKIKKHLFYAATNIYGYFYCEKRRKDEMLRDGVIEEWQFKNDIQADSAGQELNRIRNLVFFYTSSFVKRTKNNVYIFHNRGAFDQIHKKTIKHFEKYFDSQYPQTIPNSDRITK